MFLKVASPMNVLYATSMSVTFTSGATHRYHGGSPEQHQALLGAGSHGKHFHQHIRGKFPSEKGSG